MKNDDEVIHVILKCTESVDWMDSRDSNLDVDKEEEKLLAYSTLRRQDLEGFKKLLSGTPEDYKVGNQLVGPIVNLATS